MREVVGSFLPVMAATVLPLALFLGLGNLLGGEGLVISAIVAAVSVFGIARAVHAPVQVQVYAPLLSLTVSGFLTFIALQGIS